MNDAQVVVPIIRTVDTGEKKNYINGLLIVLRLLAASIVIFIIILYIYKFSKLIYLSRSRGKNMRDHAVRRYRYLLLKYFSAGYPVKMKYLTPSEYSVLAVRKDLSEEINEKTRNSDFRKLSGILTEILYRENYGEGEYENILEDFDKYYKRLNKSFKDSGITEKAVSLISLRGVFY